LHLDREWIQDHIPHQGTMCLLDEVLDWGATRAQSRSSTHRSPENPLRANGKLSAACGIEYAAQTMAVHGALVASAAGATPRLGLLASVRGVELNVVHLDDVEDDLVTVVDRIAGDDSTVLYEFSIAAGAIVLISGRAAIAFDLFGEAP
jgi:predicted hotdog family 3-hydroxylacyl-ACP dehydratase